MSKTTNNLTVLDDIPLELDLPAVQQRLRMRNDSQRIRDMISELVTQVNSVARPKVVYKVSQAAGDKNRKAVEIDGVEMVSYISTLSFSQGETVFPYVATCGVEVDVLKTESGDFMRRYCLNIIKELVLRAASKYLHEHLMSSYQLTEITRVAPGEALGPLTQQRQLFSILGDVEGYIGVRLTDHNMMVPEKSSSGVFFETAVKLESCQLCPDMKCSGRRFPFEPELAEIHHSGA
ncbi:MAG: vitamin B12 dependent-methionine synthase activation domain-containing protein [Dehalococcoidales bacterium]